MRDDGAEGLRPGGGRRSSCLYIVSWMRAVESAAPEASHAGRGEAPARCRPSALPPETLRSTALELSASCVRAGFPPAPRRGRV